MNKTTYMTSLTFAALATVSACGGKRVVHNADQRQVPVGMPATTGDGAASTAASTTDTSTSGGAATTTESTTGAGTTTSAGTTDAATTTGTGTPGEPQITAQALAGRWLGACTLTSDHLVSLRREFSFNGDQVVVVQTDFTDTACASANDATTVVMTYSLGATVAGLAPIDFKLLSASYTPLTAADANSMFDSNACGYRDWQAGIPKDVTGRKCDDRKPVAAGQMAYDVLALSGGKLAFGLSGLNGDAVGANDGSTPEKRPAAVHQESSLTRAP